MRAFDVVVVLLISGAVVGCAPVLLLPVIAFDVWLFNRAHEYRKRQRRALEQKALADHLKMIRRAQ